MTTFASLKQHSDEFFLRHWSVALHQPAPKWRDSWGWQGSVPYHDKGGVYALVDKNDDVLYIGLGASRGGGIYKEHGISRRLLAHVIQPDRSKGSGYYQPKTGWSEVADIAAVGFPLEYAYLAPALEDYLIGKMNPPRNSTKRTTA